MKEVFLEQNTQDWLEFRRSRIGASDASVIMGLSAWPTPHDLYQEKVNGKEKPQSWAMSKGKILESEARELFENIMMIKVTPKVFQHDKIDWMIASLDGISDDAETIVEIKCPSSVSSHLKAMEGTIPEHYKAQMHHQMYVTGLKKALYFSYFNGEGEVLMLERDEEFIKKMLKAEKKFYECMVNKTPPEDAKVNQEYILETSEDFLNKSEKYKELDLAIKLMNEEKSILRESLIELAADRNIKGNGISICKKTVEGKINYKDMPFAFREEIEKFRSLPTESWTIRIE